VIPNPTTDSIAEGTKVARELGADSVLGLGGGSSMDTAKAIAVEATHEGSCWDYIWCSETQPTEKTLPIIAVSTTSGTGSQVTQVSVITNPAKRDKSAIYNPIIYPKVGIVDPELMLTVPEHVTASTGFDVFCHAFEASIHPNSSPYITMMAKEAVSRVIKYLPVAVKDGSNLEAREELAWADTLAGLCIANAGVTLPHGVGMAIGGMYPKVAHGEALAVIYPEFLEYTWKAAVPQFAMLGRVLDPALENQPDEVAAEKSVGLMVDFLKEIGMYFGLKDFGVPEDELDALAKQCLVLPDYKANPVVIKDVAEMKEKLVHAYAR